MIDCREWKQVEMLNAKDVATILNIPVSRAYTIIREMNKDLKAHGKLVLRGRVNRAYFESKVLP
ncbi:hypothetical protein [Dialister succinatiphilus]|uniref:DNA-binding protein n=1 Tax=Dialister succinatiphilus YIT 11850 TaxID=742743 RepID=H1D2M8_9FIRM|nr:hypothetical protein [Dialister succinatiphilus]EHO62148.1 hypothetical protein HMPREF9453_01866 [Dialister succinatiphilus YIT 11850]